MSSDRRPRPGAPPRRRPAEDELEEPRQPRRDPRRRTAYVPTQDAPQPRRSPRRQESPPSGRRAASPRYRPQQPPYRAPRAEADYIYEDDDFDAYDETDIVDDRVIEDERGYAPPPRQRRASRAPARRRAARDTYADPRHETEYLDDEYDYDEGYEDSFIDEDDWYEEEAAAGAYSPPRQRSPRQRRPMSRPNLPRPVMPARIKQAALVQDQTALILIGALLVSVAAMAALTFNRVDSLAPGFATHISASGVLEDFRSETALWQLPLMAAALLLMNAVLAWALAGYSRFSSRFLLG
ncbi:MAG: hypothetical protein M3173_06720, partial [Chloroflexota bacterium]|nr:hypothetical protein [Chloroflexota bacterium]